MAAQRRPLLSREDLERIRRRLEEHPNEDMVVKVRNGKLGKIYSKSSDRRMQESAKKNRPWTHRQQKRDEVPDPLGVRGSQRSLQLRRPLTREDMYDEDPPQRS